MNWLAWRQHRKQFLVVGIILALSAFLLVPTGLHYWHTYQNALSTCSQTDTCSQLSNELFQSSTDKIILNIVPDAILLLPVLLGLFWGVPLLTKEYTEGTNKLVWTQSVSRRKWLTIQLVWTLVGAAIFVGAFATLDTWWLKTGNALNLNRFTDTPFSTQGIVPVAYAIFAIALGIAIGAWFRRTMIALGVTLGLLIAIVLIAVPNFIRPHYMRPITVTTSMSQNALSSALPNGAWELSRGIIDKNGKTFNRLEFPDFPPQCQALLQNQQGQVVGIKVGPVAVNNCLTADGYHQTAEYQPSYRYWDFQRIETGLYLALAILPIGATYWLVLKRDA